MKTKAPIASMIVAFCLGAAVVACDEGGETSAGSSVKKKTEGENQNSGADTGVASSATTGTATENGNGGGSPKLEKPADSSAFAAGLKSILIKRGVAESTAQRILDKATKSSGANLTDETTYVTSIVRSVYEQFDSTLGDETFVSELTTSVYSYSVESYVSVETVLTSVTSTYTNFVQSETFTETTKSKLVHDGAQTLINAQTKSIDISTATMQELIAKIIKLFAGGGSGVKTNLMSDVVLGIVKFLGTVTVTTIDKPALAQETVIQAEGAYTLEPESYILYQRQLVSVVTEIPVVLEFTSTVTETFISTTSVRYIRTLGDCACVTDEDVLKINVQILKQVEQLPAGVASDAFAGDLKDDLVPAVAAVTELPDAKIESDTQTLEASCDANGVCADAKDPG